MIESEYPKSENEINHEVSEKPSEDLDNTANIPEQPLMVESNPESIEKPPSAYLVDVSETALDSLQPISQEIFNLQQQKHQLETEIKTLQGQKEQILAQSSENLREIQANISKIISESTKELEERRQNLETSLEQLERRRERIREEMRTSFSGVSQELAIKVQGFKNYLVGSLQDLAASAEQLDLPSFETQEQPRPPKPEAPPVNIGAPKFGQQTFDDQTQQIRKLLEQYRTRPDYYGPPWQLRRTFEPIHSERVQNWFFNLGGRGAIKTLGSRLQNILVASAAMSVLYKMYGDRTRSLILANSPERLGEWRRGLQDCLGISRSDFGPKRGVVLFEATEAVVQKAERMVEDRELPLIIIDENEDLVSLSLLQFPLWLAFAPEPQQNSNYSY